MSIAVVDASNELRELSLPDLATRANDAAEAVENHMRDTVDSAVECGRYLIEIKARLDHGEWLPWLADNFYGSASTATRYMQAANRAAVHDNDSIHNVADAVMIIAAPGDEQDEAIAGLLLLGKSQKDICKELSVNDRRVSRVYSDTVQPELLKVDWRGDAKKALVREMSLAANWLAIEAEYRHVDATGGVQAFVCRETGITKAKLDAARRTIKCGCPALIARAKDGEIALSAAKAISKKPHQEQLDELRNLDRSKAVSAVDDLRSRLNHMVDARNSWKHHHGDSAAVFGELRDKAEAADIAEILRCTQLVSEWLATITTEFEKEKRCLQPTTEQHNS